MKDLKLKVCGLRDDLNIRETVELRPDFLGFIFYQGSPRYVGNSNISERLKSIPKDIKKVGVFVDEPLDSLMRILETNNLDMIQLHGNESPEYAEILKKKNRIVIKAVRIGQGFAFPDLLPFIGNTDYFLFDTGGKLYGGSALSFDWEILNGYPYQVPFFLSGGLSIENIEDIKKIRSEQIMAVDVNSRFESAPGIKDIEKLKALKSKLRILKAQLS